jgi:ABC-type branched-subunit amino acid transport system ATPase component
MGLLRRAQLNALAGQLPAAAGLTLSGVVTVNGRPQERARVRQAYVQQQDLFYSQLTVRCGAARRARAGWPLSAALRHG